MKTLDELPEILEKMVSSQKEKRKKTIVARYNGKNLITCSGKSSWRAVNHAKLAILNHFSTLEHRYVYPNGYSSGNAPSYSERKERKRQFREKLYSLIEFVELVD